MSDITFSFKTAGVLMNVLDKIFKSKIHTEGTENINENPTLFVVNHFTRMETFLLPYAIYNHNSKMTHSLADATLFGGKLGEYLTDLGAISTKEPFRNRKIIEELIKGEHNWVIFPEGVMVKNKKVFEKGQFRMDNPDRIGPPHTGAAVLALKAEITKRNYFQAIANNDLKTKEAIESRYNFKSPEELSPKKLLICPVNISYYPMRAANNYLSNAINYFVNKMPKRVEEEIKLESNLLVSQTDISIYFGENIPLEEYIEPYYDYAQRFLSFIDEKKRNDLILYFQKMRLTKRFMHSIYTKVAVNIDHIFSACLFYCKGKFIESEDLKLMIYIIASKIRHLEDRRLHPSLRKRIVNLISDEKYTPYESICNLAKEEGSISFEDSKIIINKEQLNEDIPFHAVRLKNMLNVLFNELKPLKHICDEIYKISNTQSPKLKKLSSEILHNKDCENYEFDYEKYYDKELSKTKDLAYPNYLKNKNAKTGIVLCHGYLASPKEVETLAKHLYDKGYSVYSVRLKGHGTAPLQLAHIKLEDWLISFNRAYSCLRNDCENIILGGFSAGGLLALINSTKNYENIKGVFCINAALKLNDFKASFIPTINLWNEFLEKLKINKGQLDYIDNNPENPHINYSRNYLHGVYVLEQLINLCKSKLDQVKIPCMVIQADNDPVVSPYSAEIIYEKVSSQKKSIFSMPFDRHGIINGPGCDDVFKKVIKFLNDLQLNN
jgi:esterase/lipase/1-acyl-sn-glycerol-3-phosphate acyltransferase